MAFSRTEDANRRLLRARDTMDRNFAAPLDVATLARAATMSSRHFIREFKTTFGEPPHRYLQRRRVERAMTMLRDSDESVTEVALAVGFASLGTFSRTFKDIVGESPSAYRARNRPLVVPACVVRTWTRPSSLAPATTSGPYASGTVTSGLFPSSAVTFGLFPSSAVTSGTFGEASQAATT